MGLSNACEIKGTFSPDTQWLLWVDDEIWGYVSTLAEAKSFLTKISSEIKKELSKEYPQWIVDSEAIDEQTFKIKCLHPGRIYNSKWTAHTIHYTTVYKLKQDPNDLPRKRAASFDTIEIVEEYTSPSTRPPTPVKRRRNRRRRNRSN